MTNIAAFPVWERGPDGKEKKYVLAVADSQASSKYEKRSGMQKMVHRGNCLLMATGSAYYADTAFTAAAGFPNDFLTAESAARKLLKITEGSDYQKKENDLSFIVVGPKPGVGPTVYKVDAVTRRPGRGRDMIEQLYAFEGSGSRMVKRAMSRDTEKGTMNISDLSEGMVYCWDLAENATTDSGVDDKLQIGLMSDEGVRLLFHPDIYINADADYQDYLKLNGLVTDTNPSRLKYRLNDLYAAMKDGTDEMRKVDTMIQGMINQAKNDREARLKPENQKKLIEILEYRDQMKGTVRGMIDAWYRQNTPGIEHQIEGMENWRRQRRRSETKGDSGSKIQVSCRF